MEVVDMLVRFPRNYYMLRFNKARPLNALFIERKRVKNEGIPQINMEIHLTPISTVFENSKINHGSGRYAC